jgi:tRNA modification GTPase
MAGTTRDTIEETVNCGGILLRLIDTAGIREDSTDMIEQEGIRRSVVQQKRADLVLALADGTLPQPPSLLKPNHPQQHVLHLLNKTDEPEHASWQGSSALRISCKTGAGMQELEGAIVATVMHQSLDHGESLVAINARHQDCLRRSMVALERAIPMLEQAQDLTLVSIELRDAMDALGEISGKIDSDDILGVIFSRFCIGK